MVNIFYFIPLVKGDLELSSRTERSVVKDLVYIHLNAFETLRFALSDNNVLDL